MKKRIFVAAIKSRISYISYNMVSIAFIIIIMTAGFCVEKKVFWIIKTLNQVKLEKNIRKT